MAATGKPRIADIARKLGVSTATVSRALSGKGYVRANLADRIRDLARDMDYRLSDRPNGTRVLLIASHDAVIDFQRSQFTMHVLEGLEQRAESAGLSIEHHTLESITAIENLEEKAQTDGILGALLLTVDDSALETACAFPFPSVLINGDDPEMRISSVTPCNRSAAAMAARHLIGLGHERILFVHKPGRRTIQRRLEGVKDVLGARFDPALVVDAEDWTAEAARVATERALAAGIVFSAVIAAGDVLAAGVIMGLGNAGYRVPRDVSVVGIDGLPHGALLSPPLTSVAIPMRMVGALSLDQLLDVAKSRGSNHPRPVTRIELACTLIERASTSPRAFQTTARP